MLSAICLNLDQSKILLSGNEWVIYLPGLENKSTACECHHSAGVHDKG